jgi:hypothetical protein
MLVLVAGGPCAGCAAVSTQGAMNQVFMLFAQIVMTSSR